MRFTYVLQRENGLNVSKMARRVGHGDSVHLQSIPQDRAGRQRNGHSE